MASNGKKFPLSIVIGTLDRSTAGLRRLSNNISGVTGKLDRMRAGLGSLSHRVGLRRLARGFSRIGREAAIVARRIGLITAAAGLGVAGIASLIGEGDKLAKLADRLGLSVDALSQLRFAAGQSGTDTGKFDSALEGLSKRLGEAKAGTGSLYTFLKKSNPALLEQMKAAEGTEQAFMLMTGAIATAKEPSEKAALAAAAFGRSGQSIITMAAAGSDGIDALRKESFELTGSLEESARKSEKVADAFGRVSEATKGVKATIVAGLAPALLSISAKMKTFFVGNREAIAKWAKNFGEKLPGYVEQFTGALKELVDFGKDVIDFLGGTRNAGILLAAIMSKGLITAFVKLGITMMTTPFGLFMVGIAGLIYAVREVVQNWSLVKGFFKDLWADVMKSFGGAFRLIKNVFLNFTPMGQIIKYWEPLSAFFVALWSGITSVFSTAWDFIKKIIDKVAAGVDKVIQKAKDVKAYFTGDETSGDKAAQERKNAAIADKWFKKNGTHMPGFSTLENGRTGRHAAGSEAMPMGAPALSADALGAGGRGGDGASGQITVKFENPPKGMRPQIDSGSNINLATGYQGGS